MPVLEAFKALFYGKEAGDLAELIFVPGEECRQPAVHNHIRQLAEGAAPIGRLAGDGIFQCDEEDALFLYRQRFRFPGEEQEWVREGVMGLLAADAVDRVLRHEETVPERVTDCCRERQRIGADLSSLWLWCDDDDARVSCLFHAGQGAEPWREVTDQTGCIHQLWRIADPQWIHNLQAALRGKELFLADGHHRFAAKWRLATIQIRTAALRTLAVHRLLLDENRFDLLKSGRPIANLADFLAAARTGAVRFGLHDGKSLLGMKLPSTAYEELLRRARTLPVRHISQAIRAVQRGEAQFALLSDELPVSEITARARQGALLPPKSTDFYPKLAEGLVLHRLRK